jgi:chemotaxis protein MotB
MFKKVSILLFCASLSACVVSKKKYDALNIQKNGLEVEKAECNEALKSEQNKSKDLQTEASAQVQKIQDLSTQLNLTETDLKKLKDQYQILSQVSSSDAQKLKSEMEKAKNLSETLAQKSDILDAKNTELSAAQKALTKDRRSIDSLNKTVETREKRVKELESILAKQDQMVENLRKKVANSLLNFSSDELQVNVKDGKVYVSMAENLLFKSGQYTVDTKGLQALKDLSVVLAKQTDVDIVVEGHTDNVAFTSATLPKDNWDLSVLRATNVVRELQKNGVSPKTLVPSGRSEYLPKASGSSSVDKATNRRIEIIISPSLAELYKMLESK